jgi:phage-related protein
MNYFEYNGISSLDLGLRIESKNVFSAPKYEVKFQSIPGRDGDLILPNGRYPNVQITYSVFLPAKTKEQLADKLAFTSRTAITSSGTVMIPPAFGRQSSTPSLISRIS